MDIDRLSIRRRPPGRPVLHQTWDRLLFLHWRLPEVALRPLVPERLHLDTYDGTAWVGITPFTTRNLRPEGGPAVPFLSDSHELNVRTYVHYEGVPGVWFLSLDAGNSLAVLGARVGFALPYYQASMTLDDTTLEEGGQAIHFSSRRRHPGAPPAEIDVTWRGEADLPPAEPGTLDFFLIERYCLYAERGGRLARTRIFHPPWPLRRARLEAYTSTMLASHGLPEPAGAPLLHAQAAPLDVGIWAPERLG